MSISARNDVSKAAGDAQRLEIFTGAGRRRAWSPEQKAAIVAESLEDGATVSRVARRHGLSSQQLFTWRRLARRGPDKGSGGLPFAPVVVEPPGASPAPVESAGSKASDARPHVI